MKLLVLSPLPLSLKHTPTSNNKLTCDCDAPHLPATAPSTPSRAIHRPRMSKALPDSLWAHTELLHAFDSVTNHSTRITVHAALHVPAELATRET